MKDLIDKYTWMAIEKDADGVSDEYYRRLREERQLCCTRCRSCGHHAYPPRPFCPACWSREFEWTSIGERATLFAFTTQAMAFRFMAPEVIGLVEIPGVGRILSKINAPLEELRIGQRLRFEPLQVSEEITVHSFTPVTE